MLCTGGLGGRPRGEAWGDDDGGVGAALIGGGGGADGGCARFMALMAACAARFGAADAVLPGALGGEGGVGDGEAMAGERAVRDGGGGPGGGGGGGEDIVGGGGADEGGSGGGAGGTALGAVGGGGLGGGAAGWDARVAAMPADFDDGNAGFLPTGGGFGLDAIASELNDAGLDGGGRALDGGKGGAEGGKRGALDTRGG